MKALIAKFVLLLLSLCVGIAGIIYFLVWIMKKSGLRKDRILDNWDQMIESGSGSAEDVYQSMIAYLESTEAPGVTWERKAIETGIPLLRKSYDGIMVYNSSLDEFPIYIFAYDYGTALHVAWFLTMKAGAKVQIAASLLGESDPRRLVYHLPIFQQLELKAYASVVHTATKRAIAILMDRLEQDFSVVNTKSKGFLEIW